MGRHDAAFPQAVKRRPIAARRGLQKGPCPDRPAREPRGEKPLKRRITGGTEMGMLVARSLDWQGRAVQISRAVSEMPWGEKGLLFPACCAVYVRKA
jgi:hypothetical protein